jgi:Glyoxalase-like domain
VVPDAKVVKNRLHLDVHVTGGRGPGQNRAVPLAIRTQRADAEARRLTDLGATLPGALSADGLDHYAVEMKDPKGNEFDIN